MMRFCGVALFLGSLLLNDVSSFSNSYNQPLSRIGQSTSQTRTYLAASNNNLLETLTARFFPSSQASTTATGNNDSNNLGIQLVDALNTGNIDAVLDLFSDNDNDNCEWDDCNYYQSCVGKAAIERRLRLLAETTSFQTQDLVVDDVTVDNQRNTIGILFHKEETNNGVDVPNSRGCAMLELDSATSTGSIKRICLVQEPATRGGEAGLNLLSSASKVMKTTGYNPEEKASTGSAATTTNKSNNPLPLSPPEQYFGAWNRRDMAAAVNVFVDDLEYEDTAFPNPFVGKEALTAHLQKCSASFPSNFQIVIDAVASTKKSATCEWHFENGDGEALPFTQGISYYKLDAATGQKIVQGLDFIEPAVVKPAGLALVTDSLATKLRDEPVRWIPVAAWLAYMVIVFFSDGILPGANALQLEQRTWEEVLNLSLNFFLVSPLLNLPFSPSVHPMLEGVFNLLLSWAAMFAGFLTDDRDRKPNLLPMFPMVVGMQFLTSAFLLPYLAVRSSEADSTISASSTGGSSVSLDELPVVAQIAGESRALPGLMGIVGSGSIAWFFLGRAAGGEYGADLSERYSSFIDLLSIDRVGSSFLVDLAIFALFQGWLVDDDLKRRGVGEGEGGPLALAGKFVPFFGMAAYLLLRPSLPETNDTTSIDV